jgi:hypothetical protein
MFQPLVTIILALSGGYTNVPVQYEAVQRIIDCDSQVKSFGFKDFDTMIQQGWDLGLIRGAYKVHRSIFIVNPQGDQHPLVRD